MVWCHRKTPPHLTPGDEKYFLPDLQGTSGGWLKRAGGSFLQWDRRAASLRTDQEELGQSDLRPPPAGEVNRNTCELLGRVYYLCYIPYQVYIFTSFVCCRGQEIAAALGTRSEENGFAAVVVCGVRFCFFYRSGAGGSSLQERMRAVTR